MITTDKRFSTILEPFFERYCVLIGKGELYKAVVERGLAKLKEEEAGNMTDTIYRQWEHAIPNNNFECTFSASCNKRAVKEVLLKHELSGDEFFYCVCEYHDQNLEEHHQKSLADNLEDICTQ